MCQNLLPKGFQAFCRSGGGYDDVDEEMDVSKANIFVSAQLPTGEGPEILVKGKLSHIKSYLDALKFLVDLVIMLL